MGSVRQLASAIAVLWFALTRDAAGVNWKVVTTAGSWHQLTQYTWPEIHKWAGQAPLGQGARRAAVLPGARAAEHQPEAARTAPRSRLPRRTRR